MTASVETVLEQATTVARAGNLLDPLRMCREALEGAGAHDRVLILSAVRYFLALPLPRTSAEVARAAELLQALPDAGARELPPPVSRERLPGGVSVLLVCTPPASARSFGVVAELAVDSQPAGQRRRLRGGDAALHAAFETGVQAAVACLHRHGFGSLDSSLLLNARSFEGALKDLDDVVTGDSIGLGVAVAAISSALGIAVPSDVAFSGAITIDGRLEPVAELPAKLAAAADKGLSEVVVPDTVSIPAEPGVRVSRYATLDQVIGSIFTAAQWTDAVVRLRDTGVPAALRARHWPAQADDRAPVAMLSIVGRNDPQGTPRARHESDVARTEDGPVLALAAELSPAKVGLLHTSDLAGRAGETMTALRSRLGLPEPAVTAHELTPGTVPNDAESVFPAVRDAVLRWLEHVDPAAVRICTNVTAGTPQMTLALHLLVERGVLPDHRYQVLESRDVGADGRRARRVVLPVL